jgi:alkylation response protein AidB-like acyl-CoA dehydrogenase
MDLAAFIDAARAWLDDHADPIDASTRAGTWGMGDDGVEVFHDMTPEQEHALLDGAMAWQRDKFDAGYGAITWPVELGGAGLSDDHRAAFDELEAGYAHAPHHETFDVTLHLVAPTLARFAQDDLRDRLLPRLLRTETLSCQLFSEPGAGSDLGAVATRAERDGDAWVVNGQKTWSSGARFAAWGELIARSDSGVPKHEGMTAFMLDMDAPGVTVRPIRQMSGGSSFNEVFFTDVRIPDAHRLGRVGDGWKVALTTLGFERGSSGSGRGAGAVGGTFQRLLDLARWLDRVDEPLVRQRLADVYAWERMRELVGARATASAGEGAPVGPYASIGKLLWTQSMTRIGEAAAELLGPRLTADSGEWGTYAWTGHLLGAPGYRIAGGSDEIQRDIIGNRLLELPAEPRVDKGVAFRDVPR